MARQSPYERGEELFEAGAAVYLGDGLAGFDSEGFLGEYMVADGGEVYRVRMPKGLEEIDGCECRPDEEEWTGREACEHWQAADMMRAWLTNRQKYRLADANLLGVVLEHLQPTRTALSATKTVPAVSAEALSRLDEAIELVRKEQGIVETEMADDPRYRKPGTAL